MLVVAVVAIVVVGPKDLPRMLRAFGKTMSGIRKMAGDFQKQFDDAIKDADLDEVKKIASGKSFKPLNDIKDSTEAFKKQVKEQMEASVVTKKDDAGAASKDQKLPEPAAGKPASASVKPEPNTPEFFTSKAEAAAKAEAKAPPKPAKKQPAKKAAAAKSTRQAKPAAAAKPVKKKPAAGKKA